jgi:hypothetical protein
MPWLMFTVAHTHTEKTITHVNGKIHYDKQIDCQSTALFECSETSKRCSFSRNGLQMDSQICIVIMHQLIQHLK